MPSGERMSGKTSRAFELPGKQLQAVVPALSRR